MTKPHYPLHELCSVFPPMTDEEFERLRDDIEKHGQREPIIVWEGKILDGRHRKEACLVLGIEPQYKEWHGTYDEAEALVVSLNVCKRHLNPSQAAMVGTRIATLRQGRQERESNVEISTFRTTQAQAAEKLNVSREQIIKARKVTETAAPEVIAEVERGKMSLHKAGKLAAAIPDKAEQAEIVKAGRVDEVLKKALPPEEPPALPRTNTKHTPATRQQIDHGREPAPARPWSAEDGYNQPIPDDLEDGAWYVYRYGKEPAFRLISKEEILEAALAASTTPQVLEALADGYEGDQKKRVARQMREAADKLDPPEETKAPTLPQMRSIIAERAKLPPSDDKHLRPPVATAASEWAAHKSSLPKAKRYHSRTSWEACLTRMATMTWERGAEVVCDMIQRAIASGYQGWEFEPSSGRTNGRQSPTTAIRTGRNFEAEMGPMINLADVEEF
jgi:ParB-like chromosome segregation protein Spo0J